MSEKVEFSALASLEKCPKCGGELEKGYVHGSEGIYWDKKRRTWPFWPDSSYEAILSRWSWATPSAPALRCKECKIVILDYEKEK